MSEERREWMEYIDSEVRAVCEAKSWGSQIRRKWCVREKPVVDSPIDDYEWKLIPEAQGRLPDATEHDFEGTYYVISFDESNGTFVLQHDTHHLGVWGPHFEVSTYTEITRKDFTTDYEILTGGNPLITPPPTGWLRDHLLDLVGRYGPNRFSIT